MKLHNNAFSVEEIIEEGRRMGKSVYEAFNISPPVITQRVMVRDGIIYIKSSVDSAEKE